MAYRVPNNAIVPSNDHLTRPWRGSFVCPPTSPARSPHEIFVTAAETEGDIHVQLWSGRLFLQFTRAQLPTRDLSAWLQRNSVPLCAFMPDRLSDVNVHIVNQRHFQSLSQMLAQNQMVAFAPFNPSRPRSSGILVFPTTSSTDALLVGAVILNTALVNAVLGGAGPAINGVQTNGQLGYQQPQQPQQPQINGHNSNYSYPQQQNHTYAPSDQWGTTTLKSGEDASHFAYGSIYTM